MARDLEKLQAEKVSDQFSGFEKFIARAGAGVQKAGINAGRMLTAANDVLFLPEITGLFSQRAGDAYRQAVDRDLAYWNKRALKWDPSQERFIGDDEANTWLNPPKREPWKV